MEEQTDLVELCLVHYTIELPVSVCCLSFSFALSRGYDRESTLQRHFGASFSIVARIEV